MPSSIPTLLPTKNKGYYVFLDAQHLLTGCSIDDYIGDPMAYDTAIVATITMNTLGIVPSNINITNVAQSTLSSSSSSSSSSPSLRIRAMNGASSPLLSESSVLQSSPVSAVAVSYTVYTTNPCVSYNGLLTQLAVSSTPTGSFLPTLIAQGQAEGAPGLISVSQVALIQHSNLAPKFAAQSTKGCPTAGPSLAPVASGGGGGGATSGPVSVSSVVQGGDTAGFSTTMLILVLVGGIVAMCVCGGVVWFVLRYKEKERSDTVYKKWETVKLAGQMFQMSNTNNNTTNHHNLGGGSLTASRREEASAAIDMSNIYYRDDDDDRLTSSKSNSSRRHGMLGQVFGGASPSGRASVSASIGFDGDMIGSSPRGGGSGSIHMAENPMIMTSALTPRKSASSSESHIGDENPIFAARRGSTFANTSSSVTSSPTDNKSVSNQGTNPLLSTFANKNPLGGRRQSLSPGVSRALNRPAPTAVIVSQSADSSPASPASVQEPVASDASDTTAPTPVTPLQPFTSEGQTERTSVDDTLSKPSKDLTKDLTKYEKLLGMGLSKNTVANRLVSDKIFGTMEEASQWIASLSLP
jgi:hypothetical protein